MPYINGVYMASRAPRSPRRFAPRAIIPQHGRLLQHHDIPNPRPAMPPRALSADLMNNELESYLHVREARDHGLTANELERVSGTAKVIMNGRTGQCVERRGGVLQEQDKLRRENWLFLRDIESRISAHLAGDSGFSSRDLLRDLRTTIRASLPSVFPSPSSPGAIFPSALPPGAQTQADRQAIDPSVPFNNNAPFFEPGNQCLSPIEDEKGVHLAVEALRNHARVFKYHEHKDKGELADGPRAGKLARVDRGFGVVGQGAFNWQPPAGTTRANPLVVSTPSPTAPPFSPITPPPAPAAAPPPPAPAAPPPPPPAPGAAAPPAAAARTRKRKAPADEQPTRTKLPRKAKAGVMYT